MSLGESKDTEQGLDRGAHDGAAQRMQLGVVSYWAAEAALFGRVPAGATAIVNPSSGLFVAHTAALASGGAVAAFRGVAAWAAARGVRLLAYVPTGHGRHSPSPSSAAQPWPRIRAHLRAFRALFPRVAGAFFDEASAVGDYPTLRAAARAAGFAPAALVFNPGVAADAFIHAALPGETVVVFENTHANFAAQVPAIRAARAAAAARGVKTWVIVHTCENSVRALADLVALAADIGVDLFYATDLSGDWRVVNTYGSLPVFWDELVGLIEQVQEGTLKS